MKPNETASDNDFDILKTHLNSLYDVNNIFKSFEINDKYNEVLDLSNVFTNNIYYDYYKIKCEDMTIFKSKLIDHKLNLIKKIKEKQEILQELVRELKIVNKEKFEVQHEKESLQTTINNLKIEDNPYEYEQQTQSLNVSLRSINTNKFSDLNLTLRNFDFHHSEKKNLNKKEKEKRIKELRYVMTKMEKSIVDAKKKYDLNKKKNEDYIKDNERLEAVARQKVLIIEQINYDSQELQYKIEDQEAKSVLTNSTNVTSGSNTSHKEKKGLMGMMKNFFKKGK